MSTDPNFTIEVEGNVISLHGDLDAHTAPLLDDAVSSVLAAGHESVVLHMGQVPFVDSSGLRAMIRARTDGSITREVVIEDAGPATQRLLDITGLTDEFVLRAGA